MYIQDFTYSGNEITGAKSPERNRVGINNNLSIKFINKLKLISRAR